MNYFNWRENELFCEDVPVKEVADKVKTPFYLYSLGAVVENFRKVEKAFSSFNPLICYSLKANSNLALCRTLSLLGAGADIVSGGELHTALCAGFPSEKVVYAGVGKTAEEIEYALDQNILLFNVESEEEFEEIVKIATRLDKKANISIRINPDVDPETHGYISTGKSENKFGIPFQQAERLYRKMKKIKAVNIKGVHFHIGSQITSAEPYIEALKKLKKFIEKLQKLDVKLSYLDMGGGFGISYREGEKEISLEELAKRIVPFFPEDMKLILEPGRYIMGNAAALITRLLYRKKQNVKRFFIVDAGMNDLIRPSLYGAYHRILPVEKTPTGPWQKVSVVGPVCESGDFFLQDTEFPPVEKGQLLAILDAGAYGFSMSSNYNSRPRPAEVLVKGEKWWLIREREDYEDLVSYQRVPRKIFDRMGKFPTRCGIQFWKMEGTGNDFIVIDNRGEVIKERAKVARKICQRKKGVGADGLILIEEAENADFTMRIFNPDGSEAEMCGNGARCAVRFAYLKGIVGEECSFQTLSGTIKAKVNEDKVKIKMTDPSGFKETVLNIDSREHKGYYLNTGVPHFVLFCPEIENIPVKQMGAKIRFHKLFHPEGTNVNFVKVQKDKLQIRTYERGVEDETMSCGTGAVASALAAALSGKLSSPVRVLTKGGKMLVWFKLKQGKFSDIFLEGEATLVYKGHLKGGEYV